ncbi:MAG: 3-dehydroquinate synthase [Chitinophagaceae bacterium]|nr:3-dehydroquinate synthase [Chitinophagaceae bacterium]MBK9486572.1 3-dehydroquinate synthase [Chitinophagaceae bacterium]MBL0202048.1 3-dehydroquinate synthase [Chitinophagaceae bacterium]
MHKAEYTFSQKTVNCYFDADFAGIKDLMQDAWTVIITDENLYNLHAEKLAGYRVIQIAAGEEYKNQFTVDSIIEELLLMGANKNTFLIGLGGGVVTDITGYVAAVYMRGVKFGFVPTSILAMVDAAIGGKNGIDVGVYKNMIGTIRQPEFIFYDYSFLKTLPVKEWVNGFAEIIKHACIKDELLFKVLEKYSLHEYQADSTLIADLIERNVDIKTAVVINDEFETGDRKLLNFGHTIGHAIENLHGIPHGHAVSIGMVAACNLSVQLNNFHADDAAKIVRLLARYHLPVDVETDHAKVFEVLKMDKKRTGDGVQFILLNTIGKAEIKYISLLDLEKHFKEIV